VLSVKQGVALYVPYNIIGRIKLADLKYVTYITIALTYYKFLTNRDIYKILELDIER